MADEHSEPGGMKVLRLYVDALGRSLFETTTMPMALKFSTPSDTPNYRRRALRIFGVRYGPAIF